MEDVPAEQESNQKTSGVTVWIWWLPFVLGGIVIGMTPWPPMLDWPLHIAQGVQLARWGDPTFLPESTYCRSAFSSYHMFHYMVSGLYQTVGPHWVSRATLGVVYLSYHAAFWLLARVYQADRRVIALATPAFFGYLYLMGFGAFYLGVVMFLLTLAVAQVWVKRERWLWGLLLLGCLGLTFAIHLMVFYLTLTALGVRWCLEWVWQKEWRWRVVAVLLLPGLAGIYRLLSLGSFFKVQNQFWSKVKQQNPDIKSFAIYEPNLWEKFKQLPYFLVGNENLAQRDMMLGLLLLVLVALLLTLRVLQRKERGQPLLWGLWGLALTPLLFFFGLKQWQANVNFVYGRFLLPGFLLFVVLIPPVGSNKRGLWLMRLGWMVSLTFLLLNTNYHISWTQNLKGLHQVIKHIPQNSRVLGVLSQIRHAPSIVQTYKGGETRLSFTYYRHMPVVDCQPMRQLKTWPISLKISKFNPFTMNWDYLLFYLDNPRRYSWLMDPRVPYKPKFKAGRWLLAAKQKRPLSKPAPKTHRSKRSPSPSARRQRPAPARRLPSLPSPK